MQKTLRNKGRGGGRWGVCVHDFTLNVTVQYKGGGGVIFPHFFALRNISIVPICAESSADDSQKTDSKNST